MSGTHHLYTGSGRPMPPPPNSPPHRSSSVCRTPTRRYNPVERKSLNSRSTVGRRKQNPQSQELQLVPFPAAQRQSSENATVRQSSPLVVKKATQARGRQRTENRQLSAAESQRVNRSTNHRQDVGRTSITMDERDHDSYARWNYSNETLSVSPHVTRSFLQHGVEFGDPQHSLTQRLRRSLSRGYSPQRGRPTQGLVGTELMPTMPCLQGTHQTSKNRDRTTLERFIKHQPIESRDEMIAMLEEYKGRENELCDALNEAYSESWEVAVKGYNASAAPSQGNNTPGSTLQYKTKLPRGDDNGAAVLPLNRGKSTDVALRGGLNGDAHATRREMSTQKSAAGLQSSPSRPQWSLSSPNRLQIGVETTTPIRSKELNRNKSSERERYDDEVSPKPRRFCDGVGATSVPRVGGILEYRETTPRSGGMMTPPLPPDLLAR